MRLGRPILVGRPFFCPIMTDTSFSKAYRFFAMGSPCEVRFDADDPDTVQIFGRLAEEEVARIESAYSRYQPDSLLSKVNRSHGAAVEVTPEMAALLGYALECHVMSDGLFDISCGVLREIWTFDGSDNVPTPDAVAALLPRIGWDKIAFSGTHITIPSGMEIDFGGLGKEYAVDRVLMLLNSKTDYPFLVNFGGDLRVSGPRRDGRAWRIAIEGVDPGEDSQGLIEIRNGALTTSGDARRFLLKDGVRYSHILNPKTGWPVENPPRSVTVAAATCMEAGILSTLAMASGAAAEAFLETEGVRAWVIR